MDHERAWERSGRVSHYKICGIIRIGTKYRNMVLHHGEFGVTKEIQEVIYAADDDKKEVELLFGFTNVHIVEVDHTSDVIKSFRKLMDEESDIDGVLCLEEGFLVIYDRIFFSGYTQSGNYQAPYVSWVESYTYEGERAADIISKDYRLHDVPVGQKKTGSFEEEQI